MLKGCPMRDVRCTHRSSIISTFSSSEIPEATSSGLSLTLASSCRRVLLHLF